MNLELTRLEQRLVYVAACTALGVADDPDSQRMIALEAHIHASTSVPPIEYLLACVLAETISDHLRSIKAEVYSISLDQVEEMAECDRATTKLALNLLGLARTRDRCYTNDLKRQAEVIELTPAVFTDWRSIDW